MHCALHSSLYSARTIIIQGCVTMSCPGLFPHLPLRALDMTSEVLEVNKASGPALGGEVGPDPNQNLDGIRMG